jgi:hypothetical protein
MTAALCSSFCWLHSYPSNCKVWCAVSSSQEAPAASCQTSAGLQLQASRLLLLYMPCSWTGQQHGSCSYPSRSTSRDVFKCMKAVQTSTRQSGCLSDCDQRCSSNGQTMRKQQHRIISNTRHHGTSYTPRHSTRRNVRVTFEMSFVLHMLE